MIVELHMLQNFAPSCLNRDDTNTPKDCEFGGYRRARISSQCIKRTLRCHFQSARLLVPEELAQRTKWLIESELPRRLRRDGRTDDQIKQAGSRALAGVGIKLDEKTGQTQYLLFLGEGEISALARLIDEHWNELTAASDAGSLAPATEKKRTAKQQKAEAKGQAPEAVRKGVEALLNGGKAADLALFGRMLADLPAKNIDAACQVAHAISTNRISMEMDYFTAVDDLKPEDNEGAGMIGSVEFNSACFYRYANIDTGQLTSNLAGDADLARKAVVAFLRASVEAIPTGKQNTFAAHNPPDFVMAVTRPHGQTNLANAFLQPVKPASEQSLVDKSIEALDRYWKNCQKVSRLPDGSCIALVQTAEVPLANLGDHQVGSFDAVVAKVEQALRGGEGV